MTIQELIERLQRVEDKSQDVMFSSDVDSIDSDANPPTLICGHFVSPKWGAVFLVAEDTPA